jgi:hypothetical protein
MMERLEEAYIRNAESAYKCLVNIGIQSQDKPFINVIAEIVDTFEPLNLEKKENEILLWHICTCVVGIRNRDVLYTTIKRAINERRKWEEILTEIRELQSN